MQFTLVLALMRPEGRLIAFNFGVKGSKFKVVVGRGGIHINVVKLSLSLMMIYFFFVFTFRKGFAAY